jgi:hypothetical protein
MKTLIALLFLSVTSVSFGTEICSFSVKDRYGYEYETITRSGYSTQSACSDAEYACRVLISDAQARGKYLDAVCVYKSGPAFPNRPPEPPTAISRCTTDLVDYYNNTLRSFTAVGRTQQDACQESGRQCKIELTRNDSYGRRCVVRGSGGNIPTPRPPRQTTENCSARRYDPAGYFIQSYLASHTGPVGSDVKGEACRKAFNTCSYDIKGRQSCRIEI